MFSKSQFDRFREKLLLLSPPENVLTKFDHLCSLCEEGLFDDKLEDLLKDACRSENWTKPWEPDGVQLTFRAKRLDPCHREFKHDSGQENTPAEEQCYRRGYLHGFNAAKQEVECLPKAKGILEPLEQKIWRWRSAEFHSRDTILWGDISEPSYPCRIRSTSRRSGLSLKTRFSVFERDGRRCVVCGASAGDGVVLEVDHIKPVAKGGTDETKNLQTLCFDCNRGKADR